MSLGTNLHYSEIIYEKEAIFVEDKIEEKEIVKGEENKSGEAMNKVLRKVYEGTKL